MPVHIGTSGWQYRHWRGGVFYPASLPQREWLEYYAARFEVVEINNTFYRLPELRTFQEWHRGTPDDFILAPKASRYLTHIKRLKDSGEPVQRFLERIAGLEDKLGPVLLQFPPNLQADLENLDAVLGRFTAKVPVAVEPRHESWFTDACTDLLRRHGAALCLADRHSRPVIPVVRTADWGYLRLHQGRASPHPCYGRTALRTWAHRLASLWGPDDDIFVFFNNDGRGCAVRDAVSFADEVAAAGLQPTRVPSAREIELERAG